MEQEVSRRRKFLNYLLGTSAGATLVAIFYPIFKFIIPPETTEATQNSVVAGKVNELVANSGKIFKFGNKPGLIIRTPTGELKAFSATCTHLDCIVQYQPEAQRACKAYGRWRPCRHFFVSRCWFKVTIGHVEKKRAFVL